MLCPAAVKIISFEIQSKKYTLHEKETVGNNVNFQFLYATLWQSVFYWTL